MNNLNKPVSWIDFSKFNLPKFEELVLSGLGNSRHSMSIINKDNSHIVQHFREAGICKENKVTGTIRINLMPDQWTTGMPIRITNLPKMRTVKRMYPGKNYDGGNLLSQILLFNLRTMRDPFLQLPKSEQ